MTEPKGSPRVGGSERSEWWVGWGKGGDGTKKRARRVNAGSANSLLFFMFHVKLFLEGTRIYYNVVDIFRLVFYTFKQIYSKVRKSNCYRVGPAGVRSSCRKC